MLAQTADRLMPFRRGDAIRLIVASILLIVALGATLAIDVVPTGIGLEVGDIPQNDIRAPRTLTFRSEILTAQAHADARNGVPPQYDYTSERAAAVAAQQAVAYERAVSPIDAAFTSDLPDEAGRSC
jgi:membrane-associated HD superfamily phosphohydrolase